MKVARTLKEFVAMVNTGPNILVWDEIPDFGPEPEKVWFEVQRIPAFAFGRCSLGWPMVHVKVVTMTEHIKRLDDALFTFYKLQRKQKDRLKKADPLTYRHQFKDRRIVHSLNDEQLNYTILARFLGQQFNPTFLTPIGRGI